MKAYSARWKIWRKKDGIAFWSGSEGGFTGITDKTAFYMNENGKSGYCV
ncbi:MAG: hypothetical protein ACLTW9_16155 [Enterocloster sp.]